MARRLKNQPLPVQIHDGYGSILFSREDAPVGTDVGLVVRNIPSGTQTVAGEITANAGTGVFDILPASPQAADYLPVRLTDGSAFYSADHPNSVAPVSVIIDGYAFGTTFPEEGLAIGFIDGYGNFEAPRLYDLNASNANEPVLGVSLRKTGPTGSVELGTATDPIRIEPTGSTIQPISGTVAAAQSGTWNIGSVADVVHVDDSGGSLSIDDGGASITVDGVVAATQSGVWLARAQDGYGTALTALTTAPTGLETGLVVRNIEQSSTANLANISATTSSVILLASNPNRKMAVVVNDSATGTLFVKFGQTASASSYTYQLSPGSTLEFPTPTFTGRVDGVWSAAIGAARVTEII